MKIISRRKNSKEKKNEKNMEEKNLHPELKKLRIKDFQGNFSKKIWRETKNISRRKKLFRREKLNKNGGKKFGIHN